MYRLLFILQEVRLLRNLEKCYLRILVYQVQLFYHSVKQLQHFLKANKTNIDLLIDLKPALTFEKLEARVQRDFEQSAGSSC